MKNPTDFKATPVDHFKPTDHSGPAPVAKASDRSWKGATPANHFKPTAKSGCDGMGDLSGHYGKKEMKAGSTMQPQGKSKPDVPKMVKKFKYPGKDDGSRG